MSELFLNKSGDYSEKGEFITLVRRVVGPRRMTRGLTAQRMA